jgi:hypothetical protein
MNFEECAEQARALAILVDELVQNTEEAAIQLADPRWTMNGRRILNERHRRAIGHLEKARIELRFAVVDLLVNEDQRHRTETV